MNIKIIYICVCVYVFNFVVMCLYNFVVIIVARIKNRIIHRISELENLPPSLPDQMLRRAMIEVRALRLLDFQRQVKRLAKRILLYNFCVTTETTVVIDPTFTTTKHVHVHVCTSSRPNGQWVGT